MAVEQDLAEHCCWLLIHLDRWFAMDLRFWGFHQLGKRCDDFRLFPKLDCCRSHLVVQDCQVYKRKTGNGN